MNKRNHIVPYKGGGVILYFVGYILYMAAFNERAATALATIKSNVEDDKYEEFVYIGRGNGNSDTPPVAQKTSCFESRRISSKGAILVLAICVAVDTGYYSVLNQIAEKIIPDSTGRSLKSLYGDLLLGTAFPQLFYPLAGWIADARIGRYRVIQISMWLLLIGHCVLFFPFLFLQLIEVPKYVYCIFPLGYLFINAGLVGFRTNIIQFGMDQMVAASGTQLSAFIHWYYWSTYVGTVTASVILSCLFPDYTSIVIEVGVNVLLLGAALLAWYCLNMWLVREPISINPFKTVYSVLKFSSLHKTPIHRSALTYWDDTPPSRLDLGKKKYGGPFSTEEVENVKTFFAISLILVSLGGFLIVNDTDKDDVAYEMNNPNVRYCSVHDILTTHNLVILVAVPLYEFVICPLFRNYIPTSLKKIGIGIVLDIAAVVCVLALDLYVHEGPDHTHKDHCILSEMNTTNPNSTLSSAVIVLPITLDTLSGLIVFVSTFEFIFAQSPYSMRSMLVGTFYTIQGLFAMVPLVIEIIVAYSYDKATVSCNSVYYLTILAIGVMGFFAYTMVAVKYRKRLRDEHFDQHIAVENYYSPQEIQSHRCCI